MKKVTLGILIASLLIVAGTQTVFAAPPASCPTVHIVRRGETLSHIAWRYGTTTYHLATINGIANPNRIYAGQRLKIPCGSWKPSDGGWGHGQGWGYGQGWYVVRHGDTLSGIAWRHGTSVWAIKQANGIHNADRIYAGQKLRIPQGGWQQPHYSGGGPYHPGGGKWYVVCRGDTLSSIAWRHGTNVWAIKDANNIANANWIYAGQKLYIP
jgi:LysM repeat protein